MFQEFSIKISNLLKKKNIQYSDQYLTRTTRLGVKKNARFCWVAGESGQMNDLSTNSYFQATF